MCESAFEEELDVVSFCLFILHADSSNKVAISKTGKRILNLEPQKIGFTKSTGLKQINIKNHSFLITKNWLGKHHTPAVHTLVKASISGNMKIDHIANKCGIFSTQFKRFDANAINHYLLSLYFNNPHIDLITIKVRT